MAKYVENDGFLYKVTYTKDQVDIEDKSKWEEAYIIASDPHALIGIYLDYIEKGDICFLITIESVITAGIIPTDTNCINDSHEFDY